MKPKRQSFIQLVLVLLVVLAIPHIASADDPCEGSDDAVLKFVSSLPRLSSEDLRQEKLAQQNELSRRLVEIPGIGPITASAVAADIGEGKPYRSGRDYPPVWDCPAPVQQWRQIAVTGHQQTRQPLFTVTPDLPGARAVLNTIESKTDPLSRWLKALQQRRSANIAAVALANKNARIIWALASTGTSFQPAVASA